MRYKVVLEFEVESEEDFEDFKTRFIESLKTDSTSIENLKGEIEEINYPDVELGG